MANSEPCLLFTHDQPEVEACRMVNPNGKHDINSCDQFENVLSDISSVTSVKSVPLQEHRAFVTFLKQHLAIKAYFMEMIIIMNFIFIVVRTETLLVRCSGLILRWRENFLLMMRQDYLIR